MNTATKYDGLLDMLGDMDRGQITQRIKNFPGSFKMDFSDDYLNSLDPDQLRHILFAAALTQRKKKRSR